MTEEHTGEVVKRLRAQARLTQQGLANAAGISIRCLRGWESGHGVPSGNTRTWVVGALARALDRTPESVDQEIGVRAPEPREWPKTPFLSVAREGESEEDAVKRVLAAALEELRAGTRIHRYPSFLQHDAEGTLFLMERHNGDPKVADLRSDYVIVYIPWSRTQKAAKPDARLGVRFDSIPDDKRDTEVPDGGAIPFVGIARNFALPLPRALFKVVAPGGGRDRTGEIRVRALVTPLCRERTSPTVPQLLSTVLSRPAPFGPVTRRDAANWLELAQSLATGLWSLHASGWAHFGVSAENVVLRVDHGSFRDITLFNVWDGGRLSPGVEAEIAKRRDLFDLGVVLVSVLVGRPVDVDPDELRPPRFDGRDRFRGEVHGEMKRRALNLCLRYLLEVDPPPASTSSPPSSAPAPSSGARESSRDLLMKFINEIGALRTLHRLRSLARPPVSFPTDIALRSSQRNPTMGAMSSAPPGLAPSVRPLAQRSGSDSLSAILATLTRLSEPERRKEWCDRYIVIAPRHEPSREPRIPEIDACTEVLAKGYGRTAVALLQDLAERGASALSDADSARLLRLLVGVLLQREDAFEAPRRALSLFRDRHDEQLRWWMELLDQRVQAESGSPPPPDRLPRRPITADHANDARSLVWEVSHRRFLALKGGARLEEAQIKDITRLLHGQSAHEAIFGALLLARAGMRDQTLDGTANGMQAVLLACSYAATKTFPHEYAASLAMGAACVRAAARSSDLRASLSALGTDVDECLVLAAECDLQAAEMYQWLDVPSRCYRALLGAAECLFLSETPEWVLQGFRWLSLARNQRLLAWDPPDLADEELRETRHCVDRRVAPDDADGAEARAFQRGVSQWQRLAKQLPGGSDERDPGSVLSDNYYDVYGPGIQWAFGMEGVSVEVLQPDGEARLGGTIDALMAFAARALGAPIAPHQLVLDIGCGAGAEAVYLASKRFEVVGVDSSAWAVKRAESRVPEMAKARFLCADPTLLDPEAHDLRGCFDWVLLRDSLAHVVRKERVLALAFACLKPGGTLIGSDWIQRRTASRRAWWRLLETVWYAAMESEVGMERLLSQAGFDAVHMERRDQEMRAFFEHRLAWVESGTRQAVASSDEMAVRMRARSDIGAMSELSGPEGPVGWLFFTARKPDTPR